MKSISIRGVDDQLASQLKAEAKAARKSVNQFVLETLKRQVGLVKEKRYTHVYDDLDGLFGRWSQGEFDEIQGKINAERRIEQEIWE
ncbi:MAG: antitoxin [Deltaproteobacteria bacterium]|nr:antitoxin [Deltaproteobacteria bacterium]